MTNNVRILPTLNKPIGPVVQDNSRDDTAKDRRELARDTARQVEAMGSLADFHPDLEVVPVKIADFITRGFEKLLDNLQNQGQQLRAELQVAYREYEDNEIGIVQIERLEKRLEGLRTQYAAVKPMYEGALNARTAIAGRLPFEWPSYRTMTEMKQANMTRRRMRESVSEAARWIGKSEAEYRRHLVEVKETPLITNGVETDNGSGATERTAREYNAASKQVEQLSQHSEVREDWKQAGVAGTGRTSHYGAIADALGDAADRKRKEDPEWTPPWE